MSTANCPNCGAANDGARVKCFYCGTALANRVAAPPQAPAAPYAGPPVPPQGPFAPPPGYAPPGAWGPQTAYGQPGAMGPVHPMLLGPPKNKAAAALLAFFLGALGIHNFYLGYAGRGIAQLVLTLVLSASEIGPIPVVIWAMVEFVLILTGTLKDRFGRPLI